MTAAHSLNSCGVVVQGLSCSLACGVLVPWAGIESPALRGGFLTTGPPGEPQHFLFHLIFKMLVVTPYINVFVFWLLVSSRLKHSASPFVKAFPFSQSSQQSHEVHVTSFYLRRWGSSETLSDLFRLVTCSGALPVCGRVRLLSWPLVLTPLFTFHPYLHTFSCLFSLPSSP